MAGTVGGVLWVVSTAMHAVKPVGCVAAECATRPMRETGAVGGAMALIAMLLFTVTASVVVALAYRTGRFGRVGKVGAAAALAGVVTLVVASVVQVALFDGDFPLMPYFVIPGIAALLIGVGLLGITVLRSGVLPRWAAGALLVGVLAMVGFNEQTAAAWLAIPFGLAWMVVGYALWARHGSSAAPPPQPDIRDRMSPGTRQ